MTLYAPTATLGITDKDWYDLPMALRQRYWIETSHGKQPPTPELRKTMIERVNVNRSDTGTDALPTDG